MCVTTEVNGKVQLNRGGAKAAPEEIQAMTEGSSQWLPGQRNRNVSYISRLQCVQTALHREIEKMRTQEGKKCRAALVAFNSEVLLYGDGSAAQPQIVSGDRLMNKEELVQQGRKFASSGACNGLVADRAEGLINRIYELEEGGGTALGPAISCAMGMIAACGGAGSKIVVFTDGLGNIGVGNLDQHRDQLELVAEPFYRSLGAEMRTLSVTANIVAIRGSECKMEILRTVAEASNGLVDIVDPAELASHFVVGHNGNARAAAVGQSFWNKPLVATEAQLKIVAHKNVAISASTSSEAAPAGPVFDLDLGNVVSDYETTFSFEAPTLSVDCQEVYFQTQVKYRRHRDGAIVLRVLSARAPVTAERDVTEKNGNMVLLAMRGLHASADYASGGDYTGARINLISTQRLLQKALHSVDQQAVYINFIRQAERLDEFMREMQWKEHHVQEPAVPAPVSSSSSSSSVSDAQNQLNQEIRQRKLERDDAAAKNIQQLKSVNRDTLLVAV